MICRLARISCNALPFGAIFPVALAFVAVPITAQQTAPAYTIGEPAASTSYPVVQSTGPGPTRELNAALLRLARDPRDISALVDAGSAALNLGDTEASIGFFTRAEQVSPGNGPVRARIGSAMLGNSQPFEAIRWFDLADQAGADRAAMATDRGLAYDLIGDNAAAQRQYQLALSAGQNDEASRRYALSLVIAGDRRGAEMVVQPLLVRRDRGAWRVRTFIMAIAGQSDEAEGIARATMPADLASAISPYLRYMPRLTPAQQAAAANLGRFPRAAEIGRDDPQIVQYAALHPRAPRVDAGLIPAGAALGGKGRDDRSKRRRPGREENRQVQVAAARPAVPVQIAAAVQPLAPPPTLSPTPPAVSVPWGLQPGAPVQPAPRAASAPVVLSRLDVAPGTPLPKAPLPAAKASPTPLPTPGPNVAPTPVPTPAPIPVPAPAPKPVPIPAPALALAPIPIPMPPPVPASVSAPVPQPVTPAPTLALAVIPAPTPTPDPTPAPAPTSAPVPAPVAAPADFGSILDGFTPPEQEAAAQVAAVDLARIEALRQSAAKVSGAKGKDRGTRPDGPTSVSRTSADEPVLSAGKSTTDKKLADRKLTPKEKAALEKAALDKACAESNPGKDKSGKAKAGKSATAKSKGGKDPVCPAEVEKDKKGKNGKNGKAQISHASRIWVQMLTGANRDLMGREWKRLQADAGVLKGRRPYLTPWRSNYRLLTGPFDSEAEAQAFVGQLRKDGVSGFQWTSPAGQAVDSLQLK